ncbi:MAG: metallophosphoesterase [Proteobacteria bacterium SG_bin6]|nr:MAG: metallophosphoesterase [Proteobacteria bacterium SG_bin6]
MARLFHVSDVHFGAEDKAAVAWFGETVRAERPDAVIMTGDLTMRARRHEFEAAARWLEGLGVPVTVEPGNHDLPYFNPWARFAQPYARYSRLERLVERPLAVKGVAVVPLRTTARFQWRINWSKGHVSRAQLAAALALAEAVPEDAFMLVACHHPLVEAGTHSTARTRGGAGALVELAAAGARAVLTGHVHDPYDVAHEVAAGTVRLIGAGTLSERVRATRPSFNELVIAGDRLDVRVRAMG